MTPAPVRNRSASPVYPARGGVAAADGTADHVVADTLAGLAGLILLGLAAARALRLLGTDRCEFDLARVALEPPRIVRGATGPGGLLTAREIRYRVSQLPARTETQLGEDLSEMPLDSARTEKEPSADLCVGQAVAGEPRYCLLYTSDAADE